MNTLKRWTWALLFGVAVGALYAGGMYLITAWLGVAMPAPFWFVVMVYALGFQNGRASR